MPCTICSNPAIFGRVNADVLRKLMFKQLSHKYRLSGRVVLRHIRHLTEALESEPSASKQSIYIGQVTYNFNLVAPVSEEEDAHFSSREENPEEVQPEEDEHRANAEAPADEGGGGLVDGAM